MKIVQPIFLTVAILILSHVSAQLPFHSWYINSSIPLVEHSQQTISTRDKGLITVHGDYFLEVTKFDSLGQNQWLSNFQMPGNMLYPGGIIELNDDNFIITGVFQESVQSMTSYFIMQVSAAGNLISLKIDQDTSYVGGYWNSIGISADHARKTSVFSGCFSFLDTIPWSLGFVSKLDSVQNIQWTRIPELDTSYSGGIMRSHIMENGNVAAAGFAGHHTDYKSSLMICLFDSAGNLLWLKKSEAIYTGGTVWDIMEKNNSIYILAETDTSASFLQNPSVFKFSQNGIFEWHTQYQGFKLLEPSFMKDQHEKIVMIGEADTALISNSIVIELDTSGIPLHAQSYKGAAGIMSYRIMNLVQNRSGGIILFGLGGFNPSMGYLIFSVDSFFQYPCICTPAILNPPLYFQDLFVDYGSARSINLSLLDLTSYVQYSSANLNGTDICTLLNTQDAKAMTNVDIYPIPVIDKFTITNEQYTFNNIEIYNIMGVKIFSTDMTCSTCMVNCESLASGIYFVKTTADDKKFITKLIKQ